MHCCNVSKFSNFWYVHLVHPSLLTPDCFRRPEGKPAPAPQSLWPPPRAQHPPVCFLSLRGNQRLLDGLIFTSEATANHSPGLMPGHVPQLSSRLALARAWSHGLPSSRASPVSGCAACLAGGLPSATWKVSELQRGFFTEASVQSPC